MECVHAKKKSYRVFTKSLINQNPNILYFDHIVTWTVYKQFFIKLFHIGAKNKAHIEKTLTPLHQLAFDPACFRLYWTSDNFHFWKCGKLDPGANAIPSHCWILKQIKLLNLKLNVMQACTSSISEFDKNLPSCCDR